MTDFGQFQAPFAEVPLRPVDPDPAEANDAEPAEIWWVDDEPADEFNLEDR